MHNIHIGPIELLQKVDHICSTPSRTHMLACMTESCLQIGKVLLKQSCKEASYKPSRCASLVSPKRASSASVHTITCTMFIFTLLYFPGWV